MTRKIRRPDRFALGEEVVDLPRMIHIDDFDLVIRAVEAVVEQSQSLALDDRADRRALVARLQKALGAVVDPADLGLPPPGRRRT